MPPVIMRVLLVNILVFSVLFRYNANQAQLFIRFGWVLQGRKFRGTLMRAVEEIQF